MNSLFSSTDMKEFDEFIENMELVDVPTVGNTFAWSNGDDTARSRLEFFLMTYNVYTRWKVNGQVVGDKYLYDHSPI